MKQKLSLITIAVLSTTVLAGCTSFDNRLVERDRSDTSPTPIAASPDPVGASASPSPTDTTTSPDEGRSQSIPVGWSRYIDEALDISAGYPANYSVRPATSEIGEFAISSFDPTQTPDTGGVPSDELKIGVIRFGPDDTRSVQPIPENATDLTVDGYPAQQYTTRDRGNAVVTHIDVGNDTTYIISGYPGDSALIESYETFLDTVRLRTSSPVSLRTPEVGQNISSPLEIAGTAPGTWFFEGRIRLQLQTLDGSVIAEKSVTTTDNWMTEAPVAFNTTLNFDTPDAKYGVVIIEKANASGRPNQAASYAVPVKFQ